MTAHLLRRLEAPGDLIVEVLHQIPRLARQLVDATMGRENPVPCRLHVLVHLLLQLGRERHVRRPLQRLVAAGRDHHEGIGRADQRHEAVRRQFPQRRWGVPDDPARLIAWLVTDEAAWITGQVINSEGGFRRWT